MAEKLALVGLSPRECHAVVVCLDIEAELPHECAHLRHHGALKRALADKELIGDIKDGESIACVDKAGDSKVAPGVRVRGEGIDTFARTSGSAGGSRRRRGKAIALFRRFDMSRTGLVDLCNIVADASLTRAQKAGKHRGRHP